MASNTAGGDLRLDFGDGDVLVLNDFSRADFTADDVVLGHVAALTPDDVLL